MVIPIFDLNSVPFSPQSPTINSAGLDDFKSNDASFFGTNSTHQMADEEVDQALDITELAPEPDGLENPGRKKELTSSERLDAYHCLLERMKEGCLKRGSTSMVAAMFGVGVRTIQRLWKRARDSSNHNHQSLRVRNCGRKRIEFDLDWIRDIPLGQSIRSLAFALGVSKYWVCQKLREGAIRRHTDAIKPHLIQDNQISRMQHCLTSLDPTTVPHSPTFKNMENTVHIDEKWFFLSKRSQRYYLLHNEHEPVRSIKNSNYIPKVMFLAAVARPRFDSNGICTFDGKIGVFPLVESVATVRSSQNRPRGTLEIKPITNITRNVIREFMIGKVLPAIANKWPTDSIMEMIFIQQDNAKTHIHPDDVQFLCAFEGCRLNVSLVNQPPNSPDLNVLDLDFFRAIQSLQSKERVKSIIQLMEAVENAYQTFSVKKSNYIFLTLLTYMNEVLKYDGSNTYKIPHIKKRTLVRLNTLPSTIQCSTEVCTNAVALVSP